MPTGAALPTAPAPNDPANKRRGKAKRPFDFDTYPSRMIALRLAYHGHVHDGLAKQEETKNTVENIVCDALVRLRLIPESGPEKFSRCGRTDKGVSALGNVFSMMARASSWPNEQLQKPPLDYGSMLNNILPPTIRIVGFAHVSEDFDARFSCVNRTYRYYFYHSGLDLDAMTRAVGYFLGTHNFRNFCKVDAANVSNFERSVSSVRIYPSECLPELISFFEITANSFLYHQVRCIMEVLFLVGRGLESPSVIQRLLERGDKKPTYPLADSTPLILWDCGFENLHWQLSHRAFQFVEHELQNICTALLIRASATDAMRRQLFAWYNGLNDCTTQSPQQQLVVRRPCCDADNAAGASCTNRGVVNAWTMTGCDWTEPRTHENLKMHKYHLHCLVQYEDELYKQQKGTSPRVITLDGGGKCEGGSTVHAQGSHCEGHCLLLQGYFPKGYVLLLDRETERTYEEQVGALSGKKRARYELNEAKKAAGARRITQEAKAFFGETL